MNAEQRTPIIRTEKLTKRYGSLVVLDEIDKGIRAALSNGTKPITYDFPAKLEVRYTRMEDTEKKIRTFSLPNVTVEYGEDAHILNFTVSRANDIPKCL